MVRFILTHEKDIKKISYLQLQEAWVIIMLLDNGTPIVLKNRLTGFTGVANNAQVDELKQQANELEGT
jgi:hypothetical protein